jgi:hypothetical protein
MLQMVNGYLVSLLGGNPVTVGLLASLDNGGNPVAALGASVPFGVSLGISGRFAPPGCVTNVQLDVASSVGIPGALLYRSALSPDRFSTSGTTPIAVALESALAGGRPRAVLLNVSSAGAAPVAGNAFPLGLPTQVYARVLDQENLIIYTVPANTMAILSQAAFFTGSLTSADMRITGGVSGYPVLNASLREDNPQIVLAPAEQLTLFMNGNDADAYCTVYELPAPAGLAVARVQVPFGSPTTLVSTPPAGSRRILFSVEELEVVGGRIANADTIQHTYTVRLTDTRTPASPIQIASLTIDPAAVGSFDLPGGLINEFQSLTIDAGEATVTTDPFASTEWIEVTP